MNVPPLQNLIVCAYNPQTIVRHFVLAAVAYASVLCGAARAQSAPAAPPLSLWPGVELSYTVAGDAVATLESSSDLSLWKTVSGADYGGEVIQYVAVTEPNGYYRLRLETRAAGGKSRWLLTNSRLVMNSASGPEAVTFMEGGSGSRQSATGPGMQLFTWEWQRTGRDIGSAVLTLPDGTVETVDLQFTSQNAGVYTIERSLEGVPLGAVSGTFRDDSNSPASLEVSVPQQPGEALLTLSGTGRPLRIELDSTGNASVSSPAGPRNYTATYTLTGDTTAELVLSCQDGFVELCDLRFTGPACGTYTLRLEESGVLRRSAAGAFTISPN
jgi:hypothetical protein